MHPRLVVLTLLAGVCLVGTGALVQGQLKSAPGDWPGWRGPDRTGLSTEKGLLQQWPEEGPTLLWKIAGLGDGYSTPSIRDGRIYLLGSEGQKEYLRCLSVVQDKGKELWATEIGSETRSFPGPRSTPTVDEKFVYAISSNGNLACFDRLKGNEVWKKNLPDDFKGQAGNWSYAESPLLDGDHLICTPGGSSATIVCLDKTTGKEVWRSAIALKSSAVARGGPDNGGKGRGKGRGGFGKAREYTTAAYASPIVAEVGGIRQYIQFLSGGVVGVSAREGKLLWHFDEPAARGANCATPIFHDNSVFATAAYGTGCGRAKLTVEKSGEMKAEKVYMERTLQNQHGGVVLVGDYIYGTGTQSLTCVNFKDGTKVWESRGVGKGSVLYADGHLYVRGENGSVALVVATPAGYKEKGRFTQPDRSSKKAWAHPMIAGGKLYLRDWDRLFCYDIKAK